MGKKLRYGRALLALVCAGLAVLAFAGVFYPIKIFDVQPAALLQRVLVDFSLFALYLLAGLVIVTLLLGRVFCSLLCPFGLLQEFFMVLFRRKTGVQKSRPYKYFLAAAVFGVLAGGSALLVRVTDPYTLFGSAASGVWLGLGAVILVAVLVWFRGRYFCANICPVGTLLGLMGKHALIQVYIDQDKCVSCGLCVRQCPTGSIDSKNKTVDNETCLKCMKCQGICRTGGLKLGWKPAGVVPFNAGRRRFLIAGGVLAVFVAAAKSGAVLAQSALRKLKAVILPAGAGNATDFADRCLNCNLCVQQCPMKIIKPADADYPAVHLDYQDNFCDYNCHKCSEVCPSGAISRLSLTEKQRTQIALARVNADVCVRCGLCVRECPRQAIFREDGGVPEINPSGCIGCGACQSVCPVKAIAVLPVDRQKLL